MNSRGDIIALYGAQGGLTCRYTYDSWGKVISVTNASGNEITSQTSIANLNPIRYRGYYLDNETGYYYLGSRYYDPEVKRFISADDEDVILLDFTSFYDKNLYAYCDDNPVSREDSSGCAWDTIFDVVSLGFSIAEIIANPYDVSNWIGLVGDTIDLIPIVTGVGETVRGIKFIDKIDGNILEVAKAVDFTDNTKIAMEKLEIINGFTKSEKGLGITIHNGYKTGPGFKENYKEFTEILVIRPDYFDKDKSIIYELKPYNYHSIKRGLSQLKKYNDLLGGKNIISLELY